MIVIDNISKKFYNQVLFENFSYSITSFGLYAIYGENGSGKTTLLKILAGKTQPSSGKVVISKNSCYVDSIYPIFPEFTIYENLKIVCEDENRIKDGLNKFNIYVDLNKKAKTCSKGEKARIAILRAFLLNSYIILLDEPLANLDNQTAKLVYQDLKQLSLERIIIFTTNYEEDLKQCDVVLKIKNKTITIDENTNLNIQPSLNQDLKAYYDKKIIRKLIWSKGTFIMFWIEILIFAVTCIFAGLLGYDKKQILSTGYMYTEDNYKVVINEKMNDEFITEEQLYFLQNKFDSSIIWVDSSFFKLTNVLSKNSSLTDCFYYPTFQHEGIRMSIVNSSRFELKDNEIALSDYLYAMFDHFNMIENERLSLNGFEYQIKEIYSTDYLDYFDFYISKVNNKEPLNYAVNFYERNKDIHKCLSEYYSKIYISKSMAEVLKYESLKNYKIRGFEIKFIEELQSDEIILPKSLSDNYNIGDSFLVGTNIFSGSYQIQGIAQDEYFYLSESQLEQQLINYCPTEKVLFEINFKNIRITNANMAKASLLFYEKGFESVLTKIEIQALLYPTFQIVFLILMISFIFLMVLRFINYILKEKAVYVLCYNIKIPPKYINESFIKSYFLKIFLLEFVFIGISAISVIFILKAIYGAYFINYIFILSEILFVILLFILNIGFIHFLQMKAKQ